MAGYRIQVAISEIGKRNEQLGADIDTTGIRGSKNVGWVDGVATLAYASRIDA